MEVARNPQLSNRLLLVMACSGGLVVANLYYCQPLLVEMGAALHLSSSQVAAVPTSTQLGYALGILLLVPLGDKLERRSLIVGMSLVVAVLLGWLASTHSPGQLTAASFAVGCASVTAQLLVPLAAGLAEPAERGRVVGTVMSGVLTGILLARTVSGLIASWLGWRAVFWVAALAMLAVAATLRKMLPPSPAPNPDQSYPGLIASMLTILHRQPLLVRSACTNSMSFGAFSAFWCAMTFLLSAAPFHFSSRSIGLFGLAGVAGALAAPLAGWLSDRYRPSLTVGCGLSALAASFLLLWLARTSVPGLILGTLVLDLGTQMTLIGNQSQIYSLPRELHSRLNALFIGLFFLGGAGGSFLGTLLWTSHGWGGVCLAGAAMALVGLAISRVPVASS